MVAQNTAGLIRIGIWALPIGALLVLIGMLSGLGAPDPGDDPTGAAQAASTTGYFLTQFLGNVLGPTLVIFGLFALFAYLANTRVGRLASLAMVLSVLGLCLLLSFLGLVAYAIPALAQGYLNGQQDALQIADSLFGQAFLINVLASLLYFVGFVLFGVAIWRSETLPNWGGVLLGVSALLLGIPADTEILSILGSLLLVIAGAWISVGVLRQPSAQAGGSEAKARVR
jgi:hypothetical protein